MKNIKRYLSFALAFVMAITFALPMAFGATITIDKNAPEESTANNTYSYYLMMNASVGANGATAYYVENEQLANALNGLKVGDDDLFTVTKAAGADRWNVEINTKADNSEFTGEEIAAALDTIKANAIKKSEDTPATTFTFDGDGYVLVKSSLGTKLVLDTIKTQTIEEKNSYPNIPGPGKTSDVHNAEIGGTVNYNIPVYIPATANKDIVVKDTISKGLTLNTAIAADNNVGSLTWVQDGEADANGYKTYKVTIPAATVATLAASNEKGVTINLTYTATLNENAVVKQAETNEAWLEYDNYTSVHTEPVEVVTFGFSLTKTGDGDANKLLSGVEFTLTNTAGNYYDSTADSNPRFVKNEKKVSTDNSGAISFAGLAEGTYILTETKTNNGYNLLTGAITVTIDANGDAKFAGEGINATGNSITVDNRSGATMPSTGGIGTTIFYIVGGVMVAGAVIFLLTKRRASAAE